MLLTTAWSLATPLTASPDEPAHFVRAGAVAQGQPIGTVNNTSDYPYVQVPEFIAETRAMTCFAGNPTLTADCQDDVTDGQAIVESQSTGSLNNPVYYAIVGWPSLVLSGAPALYAMRIVSALLTSLLLTTMVVALLAQSRSWWPAVASVVGVTPMVLFLGGTLNPNAPEIAAAGAVLSLLTLMLRRPLTQKQLWFAGSLTIASAVALTSGRSIGMLWLAVVGIAALITVPWSTVVDLLKRPPVWFTLAGIAASALGALTWVAVYGAAMEDGSAKVVEPRAPGLTSVVLLMVETTFDYWQGWIGQFGWIDYPAPAGVVVVWFGAIAAVLFSGFVLTKGRARFALVFVAAVTLAVPPAVQASLYNEIGWMWQGRYAIALYLCVLILAGLALDDTFPGSRVTTARKAVLGGVVVLGLAQIAAFIFVLRRYVIGTQTWIDMIQAPAWQPPLGWIVLVVLYAATWAGVVALVARWTQVNPDNELLIQSESPQMAAPELVTAPRQ